MRAVFTGVCRVTVTGSVVITSWTSMAGSFVVHGLLPL
jgi:hypothetical protein